MSVLTEITDIAEMLKQISAEKEELEEEMEAVQVKLASLDDDYQAMATALKEKTAEL